MTPLGLNVTWGATDWSSFIPNDCAPNPRCCAPVLATSR